MGFEGLIRFLASSAACDNFQQYFLDKNSAKVMKLSTNREREKFLKDAFKHTEKRLKRSGIDYSNR